MNAPMTPPSIAPQPARREPPYFRAYLPDMVNSIHSAMRPRIVIATSENQLIGDPPRSTLYPTALAIITQSPGRPSAIMASEATSTTVRSSRAIR